MRDNNGPQEIARGVSPDQGVDPGKPSSAWHQYKFMEKLSAKLGASSNLELIDGNGKSTFTTEELKTHAAALLFAFSFDNEMGDLGQARDESQEIDLYYKEREWHLVASKLNETSVGFVWSKRA